ACVVVDRRTLAVLPAQQAGVVVRTGADEVALVGRGREVQVLGEVGEFDVEVRQFFGEPRHVGAAGQPVEVVKHRQEVIAHGSASVGGITCTTEECSMKASGAKWLMKGHDLPHEKWTGS